MTQTRTWLITGCSTGLGRALATEVLARGEQVAMTARDAAKMADLVEAYPATAHALTLDFLTPGDAEAAVASTLARFGRIDVLVNNAAAPYNAAVEEGEDAPVRDQFEVQFFGPVALIRAVLPGMRAQRSGAIVNVSSSHGSISVPDGGYYSATKFALEGITEALWQEVEPLGIKAMIVQPGALRTEINLRARLSDRIPDYEQTAGKIREFLMGIVGTQTGDPARAARVIYECVATGEMPHWLPLGSDSHGQILEMLATKTSMVMRNATISRSIDFPVH